MILKVCGITQKEQYQQLSQLGVDMIGLNFYGKSPRFLREPILVDESVVQNVGVFVNEEVDTILKKVTEFELDYIQLHGDESPDICNKLSAIRPVIKAFGLNEDIAFDRLADYEPFVEFFLFDTKSPQYGGTGKKFNWELLQQYRGERPFILSGGIRLEDIEEIKKIEHPGLRGIDVNSGFEISPGIKEMDKLVELKNRL